LVHLAELHLAAGDWAAASPYLEEAIQRAVKARPEIQRLLVERDLLEGQAAAALARLTPLCAGVERGEQPHPKLAALRAWAHVELGEMGQAAAIVAPAITHARVEGDRLTLVDALRVQAMVAMRQRHWAEAASALEEALALARGMPYPYAEARLLHVYGEMHVAKGESAQAREQLEAALAIFRRLGARKAVERVEQALYALQSAPTSDLSVHVLPHLEEGQGIDVGGSTARCRSHTDQRRVCPRRI
jgi:ATP/maltotriose-dependent transcriptional regulator MalT